VSKPRTTKPAGPYTCPVCGITDGSDGMRHGSLCSACLSGGVNAHPYPAGQRITLHSLVSQRVMGWGNPIATGPRHARYWWARLPAVNHGAPFCLSVKPNALWAPTRNANNALDVSERIRDLGVEFHKSTVSHHGQHAWLVEAQHKANGTAVHLVEGDFCLAICMTAARLIAPGVGFTVP
jgi:hypothetical protein